MSTLNQVLYDPTMPQHNSDDANQLVIVPKKKSKADDRSTSKKNDPTGGKKNRNFAKEKEKLRVTKKMKRKLLAVQQRKANKLTQEELFASLAEYQLDSNKLNQLVSSTHMQESFSGQLKDGRNFPAKFRTFSSKVVTQQLFHEKNPQQNYYPTDDEGSDEELVETGCEKICETDPETISHDVSTIVVNNSVPDLQTKECPIGMDVICSGNQASEEHLEQETMKKSQRNVDDSKIVGLKRKHIVVTRDPKVEAKRSQLPIYSEEVSIMEMIDENIASIVCGETGSGKTTQIPQFLYEAGYTTDGQLIGITEPRRVAAISMSERVGIELGIPDEVSYQIRYEGNRSEKTRILFMTDGVLMKEMESDVMLKKYSAIIIDEAHERSMYSDVLIGMLSRIAPLRAKTPNPLKLIIMSATLRLADFTHKRLFPVSEPKILHVEARQFPVTVHFEKRTPDNYLAAVFRKVCRIHEVLPGGGILVFVSGQQEVCYLVKKLVARYPIRYYKSKDGGVFIHGSKNWKRKRLEEARNLKLEDFSESIVEKNSSKDSLETGLEDAMLDDDEELEIEDNLNAVMSVPPKDCPPLYCLPLYSLLSSEKQRRVFSPPPDGARMCVIATNVAETSLTIAGIKYVVDSGYEKRRLYDPITGVSRFVITRVSKASADQRAGRAGRTAAGHAYRLYSSAVFQTFDEFSRPEILNKPPDQLVLHLKSMNIVKVVNFPFPSAPDTEALEAAEKRLVKLGALEFTTKNGKTEARITPLGRTLTMFPLAPSYAKVISIANQHGLMPYAILLIAALSVREPLIPVSSIRCESLEETKEKMTELLKIRRGWCGEGPSRRLGDLLVLMRAVGFSEEQKMDPVICSKQGLRHKAMLEIRKLRTQLTNIVNTSFQQSVDVVMDPCLPAPSDVQAQLLRQIMVAGLPDQIARRVDRSCNCEDVPKGAYQTMKLQEFVFIDPASVLYTDEPDYVMYQQIVKVKDRFCMQNLMMVDHEWLTRLAETYCNFATADSEQNARYDTVKDQIVRRVEVTFGPLEWRLDPVDRPIPNDIMLYRLFAQFLLAGVIVPKLAEYVPKMLAPPTTMVRSWAKLQKRTEVLLNALVAKDIHTKSTLVDEWHRNENYLLEEYLEWLPESLHSQVTIMWPPLERKISGMGRNKIYVNFQ